MKCSVCKKLSFDFPEYREGKVYFPEVGAPEAEMIEQKLVHVGILNKDDRKQANLQVGQTQKIMR